MTKPAESGTNTAPPVTGQRPGWAWVFVLAAAWMAVQATVNSASVTSDLTRRGIAFQPVEPWIWEFSSALALLIWLIPTLWFAGRLQFRRPGFARRLPLVVPASVVFCVGHVATMVALRHLAYQAMGRSYDFGRWLPGLLYEYRKDVLTFALMLTAATVLGLLRERQRPVPADAPPPPAAPASPPTFMVRTATQGDVLVRTDEIDWIEAQGNYVALHVGADTRLLRQTLSEMETRLREHGFIRTHRRALVNRLRMQAIIPPEHGELGVRLSGGDIAPLSESRRAEVLRLVLAG
ncbi:Response regulator of the LytR/AlgR family protein [Variovorax sp. SRS16]|uniref:LytTR family DNA-binding domain-containing protein n=1 Tax=Variovorax sp. SRS16 TaxID=282217 RepID=UPI00131649D4|nr:LytTR family DNA-binding domain-containing protein [Variovorax sp. SRS16]VTU13461.1 Response regulator of the LytR/AlgR family protein [Variovorax sp. SRS16]